MKRIVLRITLLCFLFMLILPSSALGDTQPRNSCGENLTWELNEESGVLTITGTGAMPKYVSNTMNRIFDAPPWWYKRDMIRSVVFEEGATEIGECAFYGCENLTNVHLPDTLETIHNSAFSGCSALKKINFPGSLKYIYSNAFADCSSLESVDFPEGIETINGFSDCTGLTSVTIPESVTTLGANSFMGCENLVTAVIGRGVTTIKGSVFRDCVSLKSVRIPDTVTKIESFAFSGCPDLEDVYYEGTETQWKNVDISFYSRLVGTPDDVNDAMSTARIHYDMYEPAAWAQYDRYHDIMIWDPALLAETYVYAEGAAEAFSVSYDAEGQFLEVEHHTLVSGEINFVTFEVPEEAATVKVFVFDETFAPLCPCAFVTTLVE
ncbi:MAG: leucine-rich repeat domain-containing protein [Clostridia bacterium]|nr:leucine-rich repeat domain-containing protein [Clostridia bacterium]